MSRQPRKVYVAGPYSAGDVALNVRAAIDAGDRILQAGGIPFIPHLVHFWHMLHPRTYAQWISWDLQWLAVCDDLVRLAGESPGAEIEVMRATELEIPVFLGVGSWLEQHGPQLGAYVA